MKWVLVKHGLETLILSKSIPGFENLNIAPYRYRVIKTSCFLQGRHGASNRLEFQACYKAVADLQFVLYLIRCKIKNKKIFYTPTIFFFRLLSRLR